MNELYRERLNIIPVEETTNRDTLYAEDTFIKRRKDFSKQEEWKTGKGTI